MFILLANDDGILAPGLAAMHDALAAASHEVAVVAPESVQSASAHAITIRHPLLCAKVHVDGRFHGISVEGSPADCVKLAIRSLLPRPPDLVVSGINQGSNAGLHVLYSGTVAAAAEGAMLGFPAVAVSLEFSAEMDFPRAGAIAASVIESIAKQGLRRGDLYNVNIPALRPGWPKGVKLASQSTRGIIEHFEKRLTPGGRDYYWLAGGAFDETLDAETDLQALRDGYVSVTPLHFNLTHEGRLREMGGWSWPEL